MANLSNALKELQAERSRAQVQVEKLDQAISVIESLNGRVRGITAENGAGAESAVGEVAQAAAVSRKFIRGISQEAFVTGCA